MPTRKCSPSRRRRPAPHRRRARGHPNSSRHASVEGPPRCRDWYAACPMATSTSSSSTRADDGSRSPIDGDHDVVRLAGLDGEAASLGDRGVARVCRVHRPSRQLSLLALRSGDVPCAGRVKDAPASPDRNLRLPMPSTTTYRLERRHRGAPATPGQHQRLHVAWATISEPTLSVHASTRSTGRTRV